VVRGCLPARTITSDCRPAGAPPKAARVSGHNSRARGCGLLVRRVARRCTARIRGAPRGSEVHARILGATRGSLVQMRGCVVQAHGRFTVRDAAHGSRGSSACASCLGTVVRCRGLLVPAARALVRARGRLVRAPRGRGAGPASAGAGAAADGGVAASRGATGSPCVTGRRRLVQHTRRVVRVRGLLVPMRTRPVRVASARDGASAPAVGASAPAVGASAPAGGARGRPTVHVVVAWCEALVQRAKPTSASASTLVGWCTCVDAPIQQMERSVDRFSPSVTWCDVACEKARLASGRSGRAVQPASRELVPPIYSRRNFEVKSQEAIHAGRVRPSRNHPGSLRL
jgi:hypothetical protein